MPGVPTPRPRVRTDGRAARWSGQHERRRAEFVEAALRAIAEHGPDVSTEQVAQEAGVARTRLYKHFSGAGDLARAIAQRAVELVSAELEPVWNPQGSPRQMIEGAVGAHLRMLTRERNLYLYLTKHTATGRAEGADAVTDIKGAIAGSLSKLFEGYLAAFELDTAVARPLAHGLVGFVDSAASDWVEQPGDVSLEQMTDFLVGSIWAILDRQLRSYGVELDPDEPLFPVDS